MRLLAVLHLGLFWLGLRLMLSGASRLLGALAGEAVLSLAGLHAVTMGGLGSLTLGMVSRVSGGHSGRPLVVDGLVWRLFWLLQLATVLRIAATVPGWPGQAMTMAAALVWAGLTVVWGVRNACWYGRPRADGRPG